MSSSASYDVIVIGGGIVGLALAHAILERTPRARLALIEKEAILARHQTGHNSGVIHSGVYYRPTSLKARLCQEGGKRLRRFCAEQGIPCPIKGKLIVAARPGEISRLDALHRRGLENRIAGLQRLDGAQLREIEPSVNGEGALYLPDVAIVDYAQVARALGDQIRRQGGEIVLGAEVLAHQRCGEEIVIETRAGSLRTRWAANCCGLHSDRVLRMARGSDLAGAIVPFRGEYYQLSPSAAQRIRGLIYPVPDPRFPFLGVHFTPRVGGGVEAGPNAVLAWRREGYSRSNFSARDAVSLLGFRGFWAMAARYGRYGLSEQYRSWSRAAFLRALQRLIPDLAASDLLPGGAGVRAQLVWRNGKLLDDFLMVRSGRFLHLVNAPSPAATAALAIAQHALQVWIPDGLNLCA